MILSNRIAVVTGGNKGIGRAISLSLAKEGADIVIAARDMMAAEKVSNEIIKIGHQCLVVKTDVSKSDQVENLIEATLKKFGRIDILVNNAGILTMSRIIDLNEDDWDNTMNINAKGVFLCCRGAAKQMIKQNKGKIINISSYAGKVGFRFAGHYCASKFAVIGLTKTLALELALYNINVNAVCPGIIETDMLKKEHELSAKFLGTTAEIFRQEAINRIPLGRAARPEEVVDLVVFLASEGANYITGQAIDFTGGL